MIQLAHKSASDPHIIYEGIIMSTRIRATYDGEVLRLDEPLDLAANTRVTITIEEQNGQNGKPTSFIETARALRLRGPSDWSERLDDYLYDLDSRVDE